MASPVIIEAALNGDRSRSDHPAIPYEPTEVAAAAQRCAQAGACVVHLHARTAAGAWSADLAWYVETLSQIRAESPGVLISVPSIRPAGVPVSEVVDLLARLSLNPRTRPDLVSVNLGHIVVWEQVPAAAHQARRTVHFPNDYADVVALLVVCRKYGIVPELGVMDLGFISNAVALRDNGVLPGRSWFLLELDSPEYGAGPQVAPATVANYDHLAATLQIHFPGAAWAAHGHGTAGFPILHRALTRGAHIRAGFEDSVQLPDGRLATDNSELVAWTVAAALQTGRTPVTGPTALSIMTARH